MIITWRSGVRIGVIVVLFVLLQVSFFSYLSIFGTTPDIMPVLAATLGLLGGGVIGAVCGFAAGLLLDSVLLETLGVSALVLLTVGYLAGRYREGAEISNSLVPPLLIGALTIAGATEFAAIQLMLGVDAPVSLLVLREIFVKGMLAFLLAIPIYPLIRRVMRSALIEESALGRARSPIRAAATRSRRAKGRRMRRATVS